MMTPPTNQRQVSLDTETTGFKFSEGHRLVEVAAIELIDGVRTGRQFHTLLNPDRDVPQESTDVHGHTRASLQGAPRFADIADELAQFLEGAEVIAHNSDFDEDFLKNEFEKLNYPRSIWEICTFTDSIALARRFHPALKNYKLDTLADLYHVDRTARVVHGALIDADILADVYLGLRTAFNVSIPTREVDVPRGPVAYLDRSTLPPLRIQRATPAEASSHEAYLDGLEKQNNAPPLARQAADPARSSPRP